MDEAHAIDIFAGLPEDVAEPMRQALSDGEFPSTAALVEQALREWAWRREFRADEDAALRAVIDLGLADADAGRTVPFDPAAIIEGWRARSAASRSG